MSKKILNELVESSVRRAVAAGELPDHDTGEIMLERPKRKEHGDWSTNVALAIAGRVGMKPREVAGIIAALIEDAPEVVSEVQIAGPGFINFRLSHSLVRKVLYEIDRQGDRFGSSGTGGGERVLIEFVSANPVGPLHVGHGRWAAFGDALANVMTHAGFSVEREYYINDYGAQMINFGRSISARYMEMLGQSQELPEGGYAGQYIIDIAKQVLDENGDEYAPLDDEKRSLLFMESEYPNMLLEIRETLERMGVRFDTWFSERDLHSSGEVSRAMERLEAEGNAYRHEGALWLRTSGHGDEKDRVLVRANGEPTYFASDVAYHGDKLARGFSILIDVWGADHHGYVARVKAAMDAMGYGSGHLEVILGQLVKLFRSGEPVRMSKRTGEIVTLDELLDEVGPDAARYFFLQRSNDSALDFDIELAKKESPENPVFYVQYAHARICSILRYAEESGADLSHPSPEELDRLTEEAEMDLFRKLDEFQELVEFAAARRVPHRIAGYAEELAALFHAFYRDCRVVTDDESLTRARVLVVRSVRRVLSIALGLLGVAAPERM